MKRNILYLLLLFCFLGFSQEKKDSLKLDQLKEVIVIGKKKQLHEKISKTTASIDEFLQKGSKVNMIKRGAYAWEPIINNMSTERTLITIDGMRIFGACTDKMDPVTSYVEVSNLSEATICSGQEGGCFGSTIGGSIDLKRNQNKFGSKQKWGTGINSGFETNNQQKILGSSLNFSGKKFYFDADVMFREASNYNAGGGKEVPFSQFKKQNISLTSGCKITANQLVDASLIYDKATNVGYPALPMDVAFAKALITSLKYVYIPKDSVFTNWETKLYFNTIHHQMDDTHRPNVPIHMDMPGRSKTYGMYSKLSLIKNGHQLLFNSNSFYNQSVAEMTMFPNNSLEPIMFMYTWPDIRTSYFGIFGEDNWMINCHSTLKFSGSIGHHQNKVANDLGLASLQIFYPDMQVTKNRILKSLAVNYVANPNKWEYGLGVGYGERAPSVSEGYGFYLYNSFDRYDYIGNPQLKNEKSWEGNGFIGFKEDKWSVKFTVSHFYLLDFIIGQVRPDLSTMTVGAQGVKSYTALKSASLLNGNWSAQIKLSNYWQWTGSLVYSRGKGYKNQNLPFIAPLSYRSSLLFKKGKWTSEMEVAGNDTQVNFGKEYGEQSTPAYTIFNLSGGYMFSYYKSDLLIKTGIENITDKNYRTYSDWNNIPRMGRNLFINLNYSF